MRQIFGRIISIPSVHGPDPLDLRRRKLLNIILVGITAGAVLTLLTLLIAARLGVAGTTREVNRLAISIAAVLAGSGAIFLLNRYLSGELAGILFVTVFIAVSVFADAPEEVVNGRGLFLFAIPIVAASVLLRPWASFAAAAVCSAVVVFISLSVVRQGIPNIPVLLGFFVLALISWLAARSLEKALRDLSESEKQYRLLFENTAAGFGIADPSGRVIRSNKAISSITGYTPEELSDIDLEDTYVDPSDRERLLEKLEKEGNVENFVVQLKRKSGEKYWADLFVRPVIYEGRDALLTSELDITDLKKAESALRESERKLFTLLGNLQGMAYRCRYTAGWSMEFISEGCLELTGYAPDEIIHDRVISYEEIIHPEDREMVRENVAESMKTGKRFEIQYRIVTRENEERWVWERGLFVQADSGDEPEVIEGFITDVTDRVRAEQGLKESEEKYRLLFENADILVSVHDREGVCQLINTKGASFYGREPEDCMGMTFKELHREGEGVEEYLRRIKEVMRTGNSKEYEDEIDFAGKGVRSLLSTVHPVRDATGEIKFAQIIAYDITERKKMEQALRESERQKELILNASSEMVAYYDLDLKVIWANRVSAESVGEAAGDLTGRNCYQIWHQRDEPCEGCPVLRARDTGKAHETVLQTPDGRYFYLRGYPVFNEDGEIAALVEFGQDITERRRSEQEQKRLQDQLNQARKMESVGRLAGGVAHDFNNLLTVINGHANLLVSNPEIPESLREELEEICRAGERAADLTSQLLAFSRRQILKPKTININMIVRNMQKMLRRVIGEDIRLIIDLDDDLFNIKADPAQMEQIIVNLAVNAREAMPGGGNLTIRTGNAKLDRKMVEDNVEVEAGDYAELSISDTGEGMDESTREQIFEPFFTTKGLGKGTGLGLSTVYGIVRQSGGYVRVESRPEEATVFSIFLPRVEEPLESKQAAGGKKENQKGNETLLVVEDDQKVLDMTCRMLKSRGYELFPALGAEKALGIFRQHRDRIQLVLTDVVMPEKSGKELADEILSENPDVKVLFMSGYTDDAVLRGGVLKSETPFLQKPFTPDQLAGKVRKILDEESEQADGPERENTEIY